MMYVQVNTIRKIIIAHLYQPSTAATNRIVAYAKGFVDAGLEVFLVLGCERKQELPQLYNVKVVEAVSTHHSSVAREMASAIKEHYQSGNSIILVYGTPVLCWYLPKSKYKIVYECTEVPFYGRKKTLVSRIKESIKFFLAKRATGMFVISHSLKHYFESKGIKNIAVVNMFVDVERFKNARQEEVKDNYIGYCGTISPFKDGVDILLKAFSLFHQTHKDYSLKLIGRFESDVAKHYLLSLVEQLRIKDCVIFTGIVEPERMPSLLGNAMILALARPDNEQAKYGFPTKLGEYLATGKPVAVTNVGEIGCFLKDMCNCRLAKPGDEVDFSEKLDWIADNYEEALHLGAKGRMLTETEFSSKIQCERALGYMESLMNI